MQGSRETMKEAAEALLSSCSCIRPRASCIVIAKGEAHACKLWCSELSILKLNLVLCNLCIDGKRQAL